MSTQPTILLYAAHRCCRWTGRLRHADRSPNRASRPCGYGSPG